MLSWINQKYRQISVLLTDKTLALALTSPLREPVEGARFQVGEQLHAREYSGNCRHFQVGGVQSGGYSNVYTVIEKKQMRPYCLKGNRALPESDLAQNEKLKREALIWLRLGRHPHLVSAYSVFFINNHLHILIDYIAGQTLSQLGKSGQLCDLSDCLKYCIHLCRALVFARTVCPGFVHGDIKPGNCLITQEDGILKLTDFGLAYTDEHQEKCDRRGGTYPYMAPEKFGTLAEAKEADSAAKGCADIYSFGITLFELLAGHRPFEGPTPEKFADQHRFVEPPLESLQKRGISFELIELISDCLAKNPASRVESFALIEKRLKDAYFKETGKKFPEQETAGQNLVEAACDIAERAVSFARLGDFINAEKSFEKAIRLDAADAEIWARKAIAEIMAGNFAAAEKSSTAALALAPDGYSPLIARVMRLRAAGQQTQALRCLDKILGIYRKNAWALNLKGETLVSLNRKKQAVKCFRKSNACDGFHSEPFESLSKLSISEGNFQLAVRYAEKAFSINRNNPEILKIRGDAYFFLKLYPEAIESYKKLAEIEIDKSSRGKRFVKACGGFYRSQNFPLKRELVKTLFRSLKCSKYPRKLYLRDVFRLLHAEDYNPLLLYFLDDALCEAVNPGDDKRKRELIEILWKVFEKSQNAAQPANPFYPIGKLFYALDRFDECLKVFQFALEKNPKDEKIFYYLAACYEATENFRLSALYYDKALKLNPQCELNKTGIRRSKARLKEIMKLKEIEFA